MHFPELFLQKDSYLVLKPLLSDKDENLKIEVLAGFETIFRKFQEKQIN